MIQQSSYDLIACDASSYGVGAVISQIEENVQERPVAFASRSLSRAERNYAQIEREALALVFRVKKNSSVSLWKNFHTANRPQTLEDNFWTKNIYSNLGSSLYATMGPNLISISLQH